MSCTHASDSAKLAFSLELLCNCVLRWAQAVLKTYTKLSYNEFVIKFRVVFCLQLAKVSAL